MAALVGRTGRSRLGGRGAAVDGDRGQPAVRRRGGPRGFRQRVRPDAVALTPTVHAVITARLDRLSIDRAWPRRGRGDDRPGVHGARTRDGGRPDRGRHRRRPRRAVAVARRPRPRSRLRLQPRPAAGRRAAVHQPRAAAEAAPHVAEAVALQHADDLGPVSARLATHFDAARSSTGGRCRPTNGRRSTPTGCSHSTPASPCCSGPCGCSTSRRAASTTTRSSCACSPPSAYRSSPGADTGRPRYAAATSGRSPCTAGSAAGPARRCCAASPCTPSSPVGSTGPGDGRSADRDGRTATAPRASRASTCSA